ncbi:hypothetical protein [Streptomyces sp. NPDC056883]|uniref:hypothetical protein n=1 Tax=Streptomyces sp. NPDC056883 TaxID=3345959 RepID=UPI0036BC2E1E
MTIWVVLGEQCGCCSPPVVGVFSSEAKAEAFIKKNLNPYLCEVSEHRVDA